MVLPSVEQRWSVLGYTQACGNNGCLRLLHNYVSFCALNLEQSDTIILSFGLQNIN